MNAVPCVPVAVPELLITGAGGLIVIVSVAVPVPPALVAPIGTEVTPMAVGVPVIFPVLVLNDNPAGNPLAV